MANTTDRHCLLLSVDDLSSKQALDTDNSDEARMAMDPSDSTPSERVLVCARVSVTADAACVGQALGLCLDTAALDIAVVSVRQASGRVLNPAPDITLHAGDTLVLSGRPQDLARAESLLLKG